MHMRHDTQNKLIPIDENHERFICVPIPAVFKEIWFKYMDLLRSIYGDCIATSTMTYQDYLHNIFYRRETDIAIKDMTGRETRYHDSGVLAGSIGYISSLLERFDTMMTHLYVADSARLDRHHFDDPDHSYHSGGIEFHLQEFSILACMGFNQLKEELWRIPAFGSLKDVLLISIIQDSLWFYCTSQPLMRDLKPVGA